MSLGSIWPTDVPDGRSPQPAADLWDVSNADHEASLLLREPFADRIGTALLAATALAASFVLGWAGGLNWHEFATAAGLIPVAQKEAPASPRVAENKPAKTEGPRRTASSAEPTTTGSIPKSTANQRLPALAMASATVNTPGVALAMKQSLAPAPETRPSTIPGWSVVEVRDGTAVLEGPDGVQMAARGDLIPGLGRVDSIVRWGSRWIVATGSGLIATP